MCFSETLDSLHVFVFKFYINILDIRLLQLDTDAKTPASFQHQLLFIQVIFWRSFSSVLKWLGLKRPGLRGVLEDSRHPSRLSVHRTASIRTKSLSGFMTSKQHRIRECVIADAFVCVRTKEGVCFSSWWCPVFSCSGNHHHYQTCHH